MLIEDADIIIGTTAIINNMVMVTENVKHIGRLNGIVVENWMEIKNILLTLFADYILIVGG